MVSNSPFSNEEANGRTMKNFLLNIPQDNIAQFYIHGEPDRDFCSNYFRVSDADALDAFLLRGAKRGCNGEASQKSGPAMKPKRNYRNLLLRNIVWSSMRWWKKELTAFLDAFAPDVVLLQAGDAPFMYRIALKIAKRYHAKLMMYNSESYVLKKVMYASVEKNMFWHDCLMYCLRRQYKRFMNRADFCLYNTQALEEAYQNTYPHPGKSTVLYTTSQFDPLEDRSGDVFRLVYCGNLGVGRDQPLDELAKTLYELAPDATLDIYGRFKDGESQERVCSNPNVRYHGFVDYSEIPAIMSKASMLVHCENNDRLENLRYAFSTKIADSLASTRPFLVYASQEFPFVRYLVKHQCCHVAFNREVLKSVLQNCINSSEYRNQFKDNACAVAQNYHSEENNCRKVQYIMEQLYRQ